MKPVTSWTNNKTYRALLSALFIVSATVLTAGFIVFSRANLQHYTSHLNSDIAAEGLLAADIADNGMRVPDTWIGSTERRVFSTANLGAVFYHFSQNMNWSMGMACLTYYVLLLVCMYLFLRAAGFRRIPALAAVAAAGVFTGSLEVLGVYAVFAGYYASYLCVMFLLFAMYAFCLQSGRKVSVPAWIWICGIALAVLAGTEGLHAFLMGFLPLPAVELLRLIALCIHHRRRGEKKGQQQPARYLVRRLSVFCWTLVLALVNCGTIHFTAASSQGTTRNIRHALEKFRTVVWPQMVEAVSPGRSPILFWLILILAVAAWLYLLFSGKYTEDSRWAVLALPMSCLVLTAAGTFTTSDSSTRYYVVENFALPIGAAFWLMNWSLSDQRAGQSSAVTAFKPRSTASDTLQGTSTANTATTATAKRNSLLMRILGTGAATLLLVYSVLGLVSYRGMLMTPLSETYEEYTKGLDWVKSEGYSMTYSTFDYANLLAGLSDHSVTVGCISEVSTMQSASWLTDTRWYPPEVSEDSPTVYIISDAKMADFRQFLAENPGARVMEEETFSNLHFIVLPENYLHWN